MSAPTFDIAVVGAQSSAGGVLLELLEERSFPFAHLFPLGHGAAIGRRVQFRDRNLSVGDADAFDFARVQLVFLVSGPAEDISRLADTAFAAGCRVIDAAGALGDRPDVPCIVPEINGDLLAGLGGAAQVTQPGAASIHLACVLAPIRQAVGLARVNISTYHAVSQDDAGVGRLADQTARLLNGRAIESDAAGAPQSAFNVCPLIGDVDSNGHGRVEREIVDQTRRLLSDPSLSISVTAAQVPVFFGHSQAIHLETIDPISPDAVRQLLDARPGIDVVDDAPYATAVGDAAGQDSIYVSRIRRDLSVAKGIDLWIVADNQRKGGVLNALQIAERLVAE